MDGKFWTFRDLKVRGWSSNMIQSMLGVPDSTASNPHFRTGRPMRLYSIQRVLEAERQAEFVAAREAALLRGASTSAQFAEKSRVLDQLANSIELDLPVWSDTQLRMTATEEFGYKPCEQRRASNELDVLLGHAKKTEWSLDNFYWHPGIRPAKQKLRRRILGVTVEKYSKLPHVALSRGKLETGDCNA